MNDATQPWEKTHRGLTWKDMPGQTKVQQRLTFAQFRRDQWPPLHWRIPSDCEGWALRMMIEERLAMCGRRRPAAGKGGLHE